MRASETINISSTSDDWRGIALSNFCLSPFVLDGVLLASVEGFIQEIKFPPGDPLRDQAFQSSGWEAKALADRADRSGAYWSESRLEYGSAEHHLLISRAIRARLGQNTGLQAALLATAGKDLVHETGTEESPTTSLPAAVFCQILTTIRTKLLAGVLPDQG